MTTELIDDAPKPPEKRYSQKYPGLVQLTWEESERLVRHAEQTPNTFRVASPRGSRTALERRAGAVGFYRKPRRPGWVHTIPPRRHGADWGVALACVGILAFAVIVLAFMANV